MRQFVPMHLHNIAVDNPDLAKELQKVNNWLSQASQAMTTNSIESGQQPSAVTSMGGGGANVIVKVDGVSVSTAISTLDFGTGLDVSESPTGEANVTVDVTEVVGSVDHGNVAGLADDDHTQYILVAGSDGDGRAFTGNQSMGGNKLTGLALATAATDAVSRANEWIDLQVPTSGINANSQEIFGVDELRLTQTTSEIRFSNINADASFICSISDGVVSVWNFAWQPDVDTPTAGAQLCNISHTLADTSVSVDWQLTYRSGYLEQSFPNSSFPGQIFNLEKIYAPASTDFELVSFETDGAAAEAIRLNWDANVATPTNSAKYASIGFTDNADVYQERAFFQQHSSFGTVLSLNVGSGTNRGFIGYNTQTGITLAETRLTFRANNQNISILDGTRWRYLLVKSFKIRNDGLTAGSTNDRVIIAAANTMTAGDILGLYNDASVTKQWGCNYQGDTQQQGVVRAGGDTSGAAGYNALTNAAPALGGGASATLGTIGGSGPTAAGQAAWMKVYIGTTAAWVPYWT
jgi:hypothetical protein